MALAEVVTPEWTMGERLAKTRKHAGIDQDDMARLFGKSRPAISAWESDKSQPRNMLAVVEKWSEITGVDPAWLLGFRTGSFSPLVGLPSTMTPELPFLPAERQLTAVGQG